MLDCPLQSECLLVHPIPSVEFQHAYSALLVFTVYADSNVC